MKGQKSKQGLSNLPLGPIDSDFYSQRTDMDECFDANQVLPRQSLTVRAALIPGIPHLR